MHFSEEEKRQLLKAAVRVIKTRTGRGSSNIKLEVRDGHLIFVINGRIPHYIQYLISRFGDEVKEMDREYLKRDERHMVEMFNGFLDNKYDFELVSYDCDYEIDEFIVKMRLAN